MHRAQHRLAHERQREIATQQHLQESLDEVLHQPRLLEGEFNGGGVVAPFEQARVQVDVLDQRRHPVAAAVVQFVRPVAHGHGPDARWEVLPPDFRAKLRQVLFVRLRDLAGQRADLRADRLIRRAEPALDLRGWGVWEGEGAAVVVIALEPVLPHVFEDDFVFDDPGHAAGEASEGGTVVNDTDFGASAADSGSPASTLLQFRTFTTNYASGGSRLRAR
jgi:hypothetical protein